MGREFATLTDPVLFTFETNWLEDHLNKYGHCPSLFKFNRLIPIKIDIDLHTRQNNSLVDGVAELLQNRNRAPSYFRCCDFYHVRALSTSPQKTQKVERERNMITDTGREPLARALPLIYLTGYLRTVA